MARETDTGTYRAYRWLRWQYRYAPVYFLAPAVILFSLFVLWPIAQSLWLSLFEWGGFGPRQWVGFDNYRNLVVDPRFEVSLRNNVTWLVLMLLAPLGGLAVALFLNQQIPGIRIYKSLFFFPFVVNLVVIGLVFSWFYNPDLGLLAELFRALGLTPIPILADERLATLGIIFAALWPQTSYCMILYLTGLTSMGPSIVEAARIDGAAGFFMLRRVILPQLRPATFIAVVVTIVGALRSFDLVAIMTDGGPWGSSYVLAFHMYKEALFNFKVGYGASIAVVLFLVMVGFIAWFLYRVVKAER